MDRPKDSNVDLCIRELKKRHVSDLVCVCEDRDYNTEPYEKVDISCHHHPFSDGKEPSKEIISSWLELVKANAKKENCATAVHCVAGLGRAPLLVAIALMSFGVKWSEAVKIIRSNRRGCINKHQISFLKGLKFPKEKNCVVM